MSNIEFESPAARIIKQFDKGESEFRIPADLPDITFLRALSVQGRLRYFVGNGTGTGTLITITPATGETLFIYKFVFSGGIVNQIEIQLINDGALRLETQIGATTASQTGTIEFMDSLVGDGLKTITVEITSGTGEAFVTLLGWVENTARIRDVTI